MLRLTQIAIVYDWADGARRTNEEMQKKTNYTNISYLFNLDIGINVRTHMNRDKS